MTYFCNKFESFLCGESKQIHFSANLFFHEICTGTKQIHNKSLNTMPCYWPLHCSKEEMWTILIKEETKEGKAAFALVLDASPTRVATKFALASSAGMREQALGILRE